VRAAVGEEFPDELHRAPVGRVATAERISELIAQPLHRGIAEDLRDDRRSTDHRVVAVRMMPGNDARDTPGEPSDTKAEPTLVRVARVEIGHIRTEVPDQPGERLRFQVVEAAPGDRAVDRGRREGHVGILTHRRERLEHSLPRGGGKELRVFRAEATELVELVRGHTERADDEWTDETAPTGLVDTEDPFCDRSSSFPARRRDIKSARS
jgi:hypothetical protein